jgi:hypothetical protein
MNDTSSRRLHLGKGLLLRQRNVSVFVNCPFDSDFRPIFDAMVFAAVCCGFFPRCATESGSVSEPRMARISRAMSESKYSIHDLSRCAGEGELNLARFNMPLELGMAIWQRYERTEGMPHDWLMLVPKGHAYKRVLSDLSGYDPIEHDESVGSVVPAVMSWLATRPEAIACPTPLTVLAALPHFLKACAHLNENWCGRTPWSDTLVAAFTVAESSGLIPREQSGPLQP